MHGSCVRPGQNLGHKSLSSGVPTGVGCIPKGRPGAERRVADHGKEAVVGYPLGRARFLSKPAMLAFFVSMAALREIKCKASKVNYCIIVIINVSDSGV